MLLRGLCIKQTNVIITFTYKQNPGRVQTFGEPMVSLTVGLKEDRLRPFVRRAQTRYLFGKLGGVWYLPSNVKTNS